jgi:hypothetical protein
MVGDDRRQRIDQAKPFVGASQQYDATVGADLSAIEGGGDLLLAETWQSERQKRIVSVPDGCTMPICESLLCGE